MLLDGERPLREGSVSWVYGVLLSVVVTLAAVVAPILVLVAVQTYENFMGKVLGGFGAAPPMTPLLTKMLAIVMPLALVFLLGRAWLTMAYTSYLLTDRRLITRYGLLARRVSQTEIVRVQDVHVIQTLAGRLLRYGDVVVETAGAIGVIRLKYVTDPDVWARDIFGQSRSRDERTESSPAS